YENFCGFVSASVTKAQIVGKFIMLLAELIVDYRIEYPLYMLAFLLLTSVCFALMGFIIGVWAENFEQLQVIPLMLVTPLVILGGSFYSLSVLPPFWQTVTLFNPVVYLISGFRWTFFGQADVPVIFSLIAFGIIGSSCLAVIWWIFRTGWRLKA
ncbi:MAG: ABC transporter permease, partial [Aestuariivita sp.]|nr:ABC transporter permease [Aestuariivita sp.]